MKKIKVKLISRGSSNNDESTYAKQLPKETRSLEFCKFVFNADEKKYDWLIVIDDLPKSIPNRVENLSCPNENTVLVTTEPDSITKYGKAFAKQFKFLLTNQNKNALPHPNAIRSQTGNLWFYGKDYETITNCKHQMKTKKISTVCSNKRQGHTLHRLRYDFTEILQEKIPELNRFGKGYNWIETKADALDPYEFHIAIENHYAENVWTEKLADPFLGFTVPIYYGCPNVYDYFPEDSLILIDIHNIDASIEKIKKIISTPGEYERRLPAVKEARRRVIEEYNLLAMIEDIVINSDKNNFNPVNNGKIYNRRIMRAKNPIDFFKFAKWKLMNSIRNLTQAN